MQTPSQMQRTRSQDLVPDSNHEILDEDPLLISQSLTYVTDDGSVLHSFQSAPFSYGFKIRLVILEFIMILGMIVGLPSGAHGTVVSVSIANLLLVAWFWYNYVRSVEVTSEGNLRFWIGNIEIDVPYEKIVSLRKTSSLTCSCNAFTSLGVYRGFLSNPADGVAVVTSLPSTPFWLWPRSAGKPERSFCFGLFSCPKLTLVFSPSCGATTFIQDVETEMRNVSNGGAKRSKTTLVQNPDFLDV